MIFLKLQHSRFHLRARGRLKKVKDALGSSGEWGFSSTRGLFLTPPSLILLRHRGMEPQRREAGSFSSRQPWDQPPRWRAGAAGINLDSEFSTTARLPISRAGRCLSRRAGGGEASLQCLPVSLAGGSIPGPSVSCPSMVWQLSAADVTCGSLIWF